MANPIPDLLSILNKCVPDIFSTMVGWTAVPGVGDGDAPRPSMLQGVTGSVSLSGQANGVVYTAFSSNLAKLLTADVLGGDPSESDISDVVGEFTNMITGNLKSQLCDKGYPCSLSIPTVMRGGEITVVSKSAPISVRNTYVFAEQKEELVVLLFARFGD